MWFQKLSSFFKNKELRKKILFILFVFAVFRLAANIPMPGIDLENLREFFAGNQFFGLLNVFTGGALSNFSIVMLGLGPYWKECIRKKAMLGSKNLISTEECWLSP